MKKLMVLVIGVSVVFAALAYFLLPTVASAGSPPLTPGQLRQVELKARALGFAGADDYLSSIRQASAASGESVRAYDTSVTRSRSEVIAAIEASRDASADFRQALIANGLQDAAARELAAYQSLLDQVANSEADQIGTNIASVETGSHSISTSVAVWNGSGTQAVEPVNLGFYKVGSPNAVDYDLRNWAIPERRWLATACGHTDEKVWIADAMHTGGKDDWRTQQYMLERNSGSYCGTTRYHMRLFGAFVTDSHGSFGDWSVSNAHWDLFTHQCAAWWDLAEQAVEDSFKDASNNPLWFVGSIWETNYQNQGDWGCATGSGPGTAPWNDGIATFVELLF